MNASGRLAQYMAKHAKRFRACTRSALRTGDVEAVHDLRVASRRLQEPLRVIGELTGRKRAGTLIRKLRKARRAFRDLRDLDVLRVTIEDAGGGPLREADAEELRAIIAVHRSAEWERCRGRISTPALAEISRGLASVCRRFRQIGSARSDELLGQLDALVASRAAPLLQRDPSDETACDLHETRVELKRFRYAAELEAHVRNRDEDDFLDALAAMQDLLGAWNDELAAARSVSRLARRRMTLTCNADWAARLFDFAGDRVRSADARRRDIVSGWTALHERIAAGVQWSGRTAQA